MALVELAGAIGGAHVASSVETVRCGLGGARQCSWADLTTCMASAKATTIGKLMELARAWLPTLLC